MTSAESSVRGYIITGDANYLGPYERSVDAVDHDIAQLEGLNVDNSKQQRTGTLLQQHVIRRMSLLKTVVDTRTRDGLAPAQALVASGTGKAEMEETNNVIASMKAEEYRLLSVRSAQSEERANNALLTTLIFGSLDFLFLALLYVLTRRDLLERRCVEEALEQERHLLHTLIVRPLSYCHWDSQ